MHQVVDDVDAVERRDQRLGVAQVSARHLDPVPPCDVGEFVRVARQRPHVVAVVQQNGRQPATDVAGRASHQAADLISGHPRGIAVLGVRQT